MLTAQLPAQSPHPPHHLHSDRHTFDLRWKLSSRLGVLQIDLHSVATIDPGDARVLERLDLAQDPVLPVPPSPEETAQPPDPAPSAADIKVTRQLRESSAILGIDARGTAVTAVTAASLPQRLPPPQRSPRRPAARRIASRIAAEEYGLVRKSAAPFFIASMAPSMLE